MTENEMTLKIKAVSENESFARSAVAAFCLPLKPSVSDINDIKTAVSEAVTNSIVHAYSEKEGYVTIFARLNCDGAVHIEISDEGSGIENVEKALEPFYTTKPEQERSGMGFTIMQTFMDLLKVESGREKGTRVIMEKKISPASEKGAGDA